MNPFCQPPIRPPTFDDSGPAHDYNSPHQSPRPAVSPEKRAEVDAFADFFAFMDGADQRHGEDDPEDQL